MSWSIQKCVGHPTAVKARAEAAMNAAIEQVKHMKHENCQAVIAKALIMSEIEFMIENGTPAIEVSASGSAATFSSVGHYGHSQLNISVTPIFGFLEKD